MEQKLNMFESTKELKCVHMLMLKIISPIKLCCLFEVLWQYYVSINLSAIMHYRQYPKFLAKKDSVFHHHWCTNDTLCLDVFGTCSCGLSKNQLKTKTQNNERHNNLITHQNYEPICFFSQNSCRLQIDLPSPGASSMVPPLTPQPAALRFGQWPRGLATRVPL